ncbi:MAG: reverse transcriptase domain-containing protein [Candidatus Thiodiazotropha endolucinida]|nr:reverse transcriptase domain-containing protein [Candidatus Thiodiazotropha endolucinida]
MDYDSNSSANDCLFNDDFSNNKKAVENQTISGSVPLLSTLDTDITNSQTEPVVQTNINFKHRGIHFCNLNIRHLKPKIDDIKLLLNQTNSIDVFGICETFLNTTIDNDSIHVDGYQIERKDRYENASTAPGKGGGILFYLANHIDYVRRNNLESPDIESIWLEIKLKNNRPFLVCSFYRPPSANAEWYDNFSKQIENSLSISDEVYIMGDINIDFRAGYLSKPKWKHIVEINDLQQVIDKPTRVTAHSSTLIDHLYVSNPYFLSDITVPCIAISDHYPICFTRKTSKNTIKRKDHQTIQYRCFKTFSDDIFLKELSDALQTFNVTQNNPNENFDSWTNILFTILNKHAPLKTKRVKRNNQPGWMNDDIKVAITQRDINHCNKNWNEYKYWRNQTTTLIRSAKKDFFNKAITENKDNAYLWRHIKDLNGKTSASKLPAELVIDGTSFCKPQDIVENLNIFFSSLSDTLNSSQPINGSEVNWKTLSEHIENKVPADVKFRIPIMKLSDLKSYINSLDASKATGLDGISPRIIKLSSDIICPTLLDIINVGFISGNFPDSLKTARINPIHKGGARCDPANYRPISILSVISKIIEKHVTKHLFGYLNKYQLLHKSQSGFRKHHSCNTALINLVDNWLKGIDNCETVGAIFFDLRKAFDVVDHNLLLKKLASYKFDPMSLNWVRSYLTNRSQCILENSLKSSFQSIKAGVPQGSVLGPVLFLLFVNDLPLFINEAHIDMYADDATVHHANKCMDVVETTIQGGGIDFSNWCLSNKMYINLSKTSVMTIGTRQNLQNSNSINIYLNNELLHQTDTQRLLGIEIDKTLSWDVQIDSVCQSVARKITLMKQLSKYVNKESLKQYYLSYILPIFDYGCIIWSRCSVANTNRLLKLQKRAARIILRCDFLTPSENMFKELQWLSFPKRVQYHTIIMTHKALNGQTPAYISNMFTKTSDIHNRCLRSTDNDDLRVPFFRTRYYENSFSVNGAKLWNSLPPNIRQITNVNSFKKAVRSYLLNSNSN